MQLSPQIVSFLAKLFLFSQPIFLPTVGKVMFLQASVILSTIGLMATRPLRILVTAGSARILLECILVILKDLFYLFMGVQLL